VAPRQGIDQTVEATVRQFNRPVRFREIADTLAPRGVTKSQLHNAVYRLHKKGRLETQGSGSATAYVISES
jgi:hypothetical protein